MLQQGTEQRHKVFAGSQIFLQAHPGTWPAVQIPAVVFDSMERRGGSAVYFSVLAVTCFHFMLQLITILNRCHRFPGFVYQQARFSSDHQSIEIAVRPRKGSKAVCSRCHKPAPGYDQLTERMSSIIRPGLFRNFDARHGAGPVKVAGMEYGRTRARRSSKPARPYIWRLIILRRLICPSTWPVLHGVSTAAATAEMSFCRP
jgi:hypothetical protein